jgi:hypothetical protein
VIANHYWPTTFTCAQLTSELHRLDSKYALQVCFLENIQHMKAVCASASDVMEVEWLEEQALSDVMSCIVCRHIFVPSQQLILHVCADSWFFSTLTYFASDLSVFTLLQCALFQAFPANAAHPHDNDDDWGGAVA